MTDRIEQIARIIEPTAWQGIASAPKDGSDFLAFFPKCIFVEDMHDPSDLGHLEDVIATVKYVNGHLEGNTYFITPGEPTHWQPLPAPPK